MYASFLVRTFDMFLFEIKFSIDVLASEEKVRSKGNEVANTFNERCENGALSFYHFFYVWKNLF